MKTLKSFTLTLGLALMFSVVAFAQNAGQNDQPKQGESCCVMKDGAKNHAAKEGCCCSGDSCDMKMKESMKNDAAKEECCCCSGDSCDMKMKDMKPAQG